MKLFQEKFPSYSRFFQYLFDWLLCKMFTSTSDLHASAPFSNIKATVADPKNFLTMSNSMHINADRRWIAEQLPNGNWTRYWRSGSITLCQVIFAVTHLVKYAVSRNVQKINRKLLNFSLKHILLKINIISDYVSNISIFVAWWFQTYDS